MSTRSTDGSARVDTAVRALGWFSIALGAVELLAPRSTARAAGVTAPDVVTRSYGARELACGVGLLYSRKPTTFLLARVAGDLLDLATIAASSRQRSNPRRSRAWVALATVAGITAIDAVSARASSRNQTAQRCRIRSAPLQDYSMRSGFPRPVSEMRGAALSDFVMPRDMRAPDALLPLTRQRG